MDVSPSVEPNDDLYGWELGVLPIPGMAQNAYLCHMFVPKRESPFGFFNAVISSRSIYKWKIKAFFSFGWA